MLATDSDCSALQFFPRDFFYLQMFLFINKDFLLQLHLKLVLKDL